MLTNTIQVSINKMEITRKLDNRVVNLSDFTLNQHHINVLSKGLKFCPTPGPPNAGELRDDMDRIPRRIRQIAFFENPEDDDSFTAPPSQGPPPANLHSLEPFKHRKFKLPATG